jgi:hypothetical protein
MDEVFWLSYTPSARYFVESKFIGSVRHQDRLTQVTGSTFGIDGSLVSEIDALRVPSKGHFYSDEFLVTAGLPSKPTRIRACKCFVKH